MTELKPCPFCGGEAEFYPAACIEKGWYIATVQCVSCAAQVCSKPGLDRAEQEANESAIQAWNTRAERTCKPIPKYIDDSPWPVMVCSECRRPLHYDGDESGVVEYQPYCGCGAKVVE